MDKFEIDYFGFENENELNEIDIDRWNQFKVRKNVSHVLCGFDPHFNLTKGKNHNCSFNFIRLSTISVPLKCFKN